MTQRRVFSASSVAQATDGIAAVREAGAHEHGIALVARSDIEIEAIPDELKLAETDFKPAALRGAGVGAVTGTLAGLLAATVPPLGLTLAGAMIGGGAAGALVGTWASSLVGASIPEPVRRRFEHEIASGRILLVVDADEAVQDAVARRLADLGLVAMDDRIADAS
jgi:hypothetical protein